MTALSSTITTSIVNDVLARDREIGACTTDHCRVTLALRGYADVLGRIGAALPASEPSVARLASARNRLAQVQGSAQGLQNASGASPLPGIAIGVLGGAVVGYLVARMGS